MAKTPPRPGLDQVVEDLRRRRQPPPPPDAPFDPRPQKRTPPRPPREGEDKTEHQTKRAALFDELAKLGAITDAQARQSLDRLDALEKSKPTLGQMGRYGAVGAVAGPALHLAGNLAKGRGVKGLVDVAKNEAGEAYKTLGRARTLGSSAVTGALSASAIPIARHALDRRAEMKNLRTYLHEQSPTP